MKATLTSVRIESRSNPSPNSSLLYCMPHNAVTHSAGIHASPRTPCFIMKGRFVLATQVQSERALEPVYLFIHLYVFCLAGGLRGDCAEPQRELSGGGEGSGSSQETVPGCLRRAC